MDIFEIIMIVFGVPIFTSVLILSYLIIGMLLKDECDIYLPPFKVKGERE